MEGLDRPSAVFLLVPVLAKWHAGGYDPSRSWSSAGRPPLAAPVHYRHRPASPAARKGHGRGPPDPLPDRCVKMRISLYADDAVLFANPIKQEINTLMDILQRLGQASGLQINPAKSSVTAIRGEVLQNFGGQIVGFPLKYLGLPITISRLRMVHLQFILDRIKAGLLVGRDVSCPWPAGECWSDAS